MERSDISRVAAVLVCLLPAVTFVSGETVTETEALGLFLESSPQVQAIPLAAESAGAGVRPESLFSNPAVAFQVEDAGGTRDRFLTIDQDLPISGRRPLLRRTASAAASAAELEAAYRVQTAAYELRSSFYEVLYREQVLERRRHAAETIARMVEILEQREKAGEGSGYDVLRAQQEQDILEMLLAEAEADVGSARSRFGGFFDPALRMETARLEGEFRTSASTPGADEAVELAWKNRPDLRALRADAERRGLEQRAVRRQRIPEPTLTAGWKKTDEAGLSDTGFVAALSVRLPIFNRGGVRARQARADRLRAELELDARRREVRAEVLSALAGERAATKVARSQGADVEKRAGELRRVARLAYDEGAKGILELLDAYQSSLDMELRSLELNYEAKRAEIELNRAIGVEVLP